MSDLHQFNPGRKSWKMYANTITSISGDDLTISPYDGQNLILEVSGNNEIIFKKGDTSYNLADLSNIATSSGGSGIQNGDDVSFQNVDISGTLTIDGSNIIINNKNISVTEGMATGYSQLGLDISGEDANDESGHGLAMSYNGTRLAIGATRNKAGTTLYKGHVRVFDWNGSSWNQVGADIDNTDISSSKNGKFGLNLSMSNDGNILAVSNHWWDNSGSSSNNSNWRKGRVHVYNYSNNNWSLRGDIFEGISSNDQLGYGLSLSDNGLRIFIGIIHDNGGSVKIYDWSGNTWVSNGSVNSWANSQNFGNSVSSNGNGNTFAVTAPAGGSGGYVNVYDYDNSSWTLRANPNTLISNNNVSIDEQAYKLALSSDGNRLILANRDADNNGYNSGSVWTYEWNGSDWVQVATRIDGDANSDGFGYSISLSDDGNRLVVGAPLNDSVSNLAGQAKVYQYINSDWSQIGTDILGDSNAVYLGIAVAMSGNGNNFSIGAYRDDPNGTSSGNTQIFNINTNESTLKFDGSNVAIKDDVDASFALYTLTSDLYTKNDLESGNLDLSFQNVDISGALKIDGSNIIPIPSQTSNSGKYLTTNGSNLSWGTVSTGGGGGGLSQYATFTYQPAGTEQTPNATFTAIQYDTINTQNSSSDITLDTTTNIGRITLASTGVYMINYYTTGYYSASTNRNTIESAIFVDSGSGFAEEIGTSTFSYTRFNHPESTCSCSYLLNVSSSNTEIEIRMKTEDGTTTSKIKKECTGITIVKIA